MISSGSGLSLPNSRNRQPWLRPVAIGAVTVIAVLLVLYVYGKMSGEDGCAAVYCDSGLDLAAPAGFIRESAVFRFNEQFAGSYEGQDVQLDIPLNGPVSPNSVLSFYQVDETSGTWTSLERALIDDDGKVATALLPSAPQLVTVLRQSARTGQVVAYFDASVDGAKLHADASQLATIIHTLDYTPNEDGSLDGSPSNLTAQGPGSLRPVVSAGTDIPGSLIAVDSIFRTSPDTSRHVQAIVKEVLARDLKGIDIAYMDLEPDMRTSFTLFIKDLAEQLHSHGRALTLTIPAPVLGPQRVDEAAYDWAQLGSAADLIKIAPYRDQSTFRLAMPDILEYLTGRVNAAKLILTVTPYATEKSAEGLTTMSLTDAMGIATQLSSRLESGTALVPDEPVEVVGVNIERDENLTGIRWDPNTATVAFSYKLGGTGRTVWIENGLSVPFKLELINLYGLGGVAIEDASDDRFLGDIWEPIVAFIETGQPKLIQPNSEDLAPRWSADGGELAGGERGIATWTAQEEGLYTVFLTLSDGSSLFQREIRLLIQSPAETE